jgi:hypothetical protein
MRQYGTERKHCLEQGSGRSLVSININDYVICKGQTTAPDEPPTRLSPNQGTSVCFANAKRQLAVVHHRYLPCMLIAAVGLHTMRCGCTLQLSAQSIPERSAPQAAGSSWIRAAPQLAPEVPNWGHECSYGLCLCVSAPWFWLCAACCCWVLVHTRLEQDSLKLCLQHNRLVLL